MERTQKAKTSMSDDDLETQNDIISKMEILLGDLSIATGEDTRPVILQSDPYLNHIVHTGVVMINQVLVHSRIDRYHRNRLYQELYPELTIWANILDNRRQYPPTGFRHWWNTIITPAEMSVHEIIDNSKQYRHIFAETINHTEEQLTIDDMEKVFHYLNYLVKQAYRGDNETIHIFHQLTIILRYLTTTMDGEMLVSLAYLQLKQLCVDLYRVDRISKTYINFFE